MQKILNMQITHFKNRSKQIRFHGTYILHFLNWKEAHFQNWVRSQRNMESKLTPKHKIAQLLSKKKIAFFLTIALETIFYFCSYFQIYFPFLTFHRSDCEFWYRIFDIHFQTFDKRLSPFFIILKEPHTSHTFGTSKNHSLHKTQL